MKKLFVLLLVLASCNHPRDMVVYACDCKEKEKVVLDIKESIKNANNMSDEEMEDVIIQLERTFVRTNCHQAKVKGIQRDGWWEITQTDSCMTYYNY